MNASDDDFATGAVSLAEVLDAAEAEGVRAEFDIEAHGAAEQSPTDAPAESGRLRCSACGRTSDAGEFTRSWTRRLEGASDPADMLHVSGLQCPNCSSLGVLISPYGASADPEHAEILRRLPPSPS